MKKLKYILVLLVLLSCKNGSCQNVFRTPSLFRDKWIFSELYDAKCVDSSFYIKDGIVTKKWVLKCTPSKDKMLNVWYITHDCIYEIKYRASGKQIFWLGSQQYNINL